MLAVTHTLSLVLNLAVFFSPLMDAGSVSYSFDALQPGCLFPRGPAGITRRKFEEGYRKYWMKITHFGANLKVDHIGSNQKAKRGALFPICLSPCVAQL